MRHGEFMPWVEKSFTSTYRQATNYIKLAEANQNGSQLPFWEVTNPKPKWTSKPRASSRRQATPKPTETPSVAPQIDFKDFNREAADDKDERQILRKLGLLIIDHGYRNLVKQFHPDKGGSNHSHGQAQP